MQKSINFFHNEDKILTSYDNIFYVKKDNEWEEVENKSIFKGEGEPSNNEGDEGDYYIKYDKIYNLLNSSEIFNKYGWTANNVSFMNINNTYNEYIPYAKCKKICPNSNNTTHDISYNVLANDSGKYWCFSIYVSPQEFNYFQISFSNYSETFAIKSKFSRVLMNRRYVLSKELEITGDPVANDFENDDISYDIIDVGNNFYRIFLSCKFNVTTDLKFKFSILKNDNGTIKDKYANTSANTGLFINAAQLTNTKEPMEYVVTSNYSFSYYNFDSLYKKESNWVKLPEYNMVHYGDDEPSNSLGMDGDIYFYNSIIKLGEVVRFGENHFYYGWKNSDSSDTKIYYTYKEYPAVGDKLYYYNNKIVEVGEITSITRGSPTSIVVNSVTYNKSTNHNDRLIKEPGVLFWNKENKTYSFVNNKRKVCNLKYDNKTLYNSKLIIDALTYSTNLFSETWDTHCTNQLKQFQFGFNSGGHGNFWDYNNLRKYY